MRFTFFTQREDADVNVQIDDDSSNLLEKGNIQCYNCTRSTHGQNWIEGSLTLYRYQIEASN